MREATPYAPPKAEPRTDESLSAADLENADTVREAHLLHERAMRSVAGLYMFSAALYLVPVWRTLAAALASESLHTELLQSLAGCTLSALLTGLFAPPLVIILGLLSSSAPGPNSGWIAVGCILLITSGALMAWLAYSIFSLRAWTRIPVCWLAALGLIQFPIGTVLNSYVLYLFIAPSAGVLLSPRYRAVVAATQALSIRSPRARIAYAGFALLLAGLVSALGRLG